MTTTTALPPTTESSLPWVPLAEAAAWLALAPRTLSGWGPAYGLPVRRHAGRLWVPFPMALALQLSLDEVRGARLGGWGNAGTARDRGVTMRSAWAVHAARDGAAPEVVAAGFALLAASERGVRP
jgi:hypothetical protein